MSLRRLHHIQPESFAFTPANQAWAEAQIAKYPEGRQASAVIPLLWRAQEQEGWVTKPMIEEVAKLLDMAEIRVLEVASFYFMFHLQPVGSLAHVQVCGTTSCMICGAEDLIGVCKKKIAPNPHELSPDGRFSWEEVECLGACANAPMVQIGKDYYEDLTARKFEMILDALAKGDVPAPGPQNGRFASEPITGLTSLRGRRVHDANASIALAATRGDTLGRVDGDRRKTPKRAAPPRENGTISAKAAAKATGAGEAELTLHDHQEKGHPETRVAAGSYPQLLKEPRGGNPDDLKKIKGVGPKIENLLHGLGVFHFDQIGAWTEAEVAWVDARLNFKGRIARDDWIGQAKALAGVKGDA